MGTNNNKILIITTGGTIAMKYDEKLGGSVPALDGKTLLSSIHNSPILKELEIYEYSNKPSPHLTIEDLFNIAKLIKANKNKYKGFIITCGTDVLEEVAFFLDTVIPDEIKVVITASMRSNNELGIDGPRNLLGAIKTIDSKYSDNYGVLVVLNDEIHDPDTVTKTYTSNVSTFNSPGFGLLGIVDEDKIYMGRKKVRRILIDTNKFEKNIYLYKTYIDDNGEYLKYLVENKKPKGLIIEGFGRGNVPPKLVPYIKKLLDNGTIIIISTRCHLGRVLGIYSYVGGGKFLENIGVLLSGDLKPHKAYILLGLLLGANYPKDKIKNILQKF